MDTEPNFVGSVVSLDCGESLGVYQGEVSKVNKLDQTICLIRVYRNGVKCQVDEVTIRASHIKDLKILQNVEEIAKERRTSKVKNGARTKLKFETPQNNVGAQSDGSPKFAGMQAPPMKIATPQRSKVSAVRSSESIGVSGSNLKTSVGASPSKGVHFVQDLEISQQQQQRQQNNNGNSEHTFYIQNRTKETNSPASPAKNNTTIRRRNTYAAADNNKRNYTKPIDINSQRAKKEDCFSAPIDDSYLTDFDFEKNLALFDKAALHQELDRKESQDDLALERVKRKNFRHDENIIQPKSLPKVAAAETKMTKFPSNKEYKTDEGLVVPQISYQLRSQLFALAEKCGYSVSRRMEAVGIVASQMALKVLGASNRLIPSNNHQRPTAVVLCGPHLQGAQGLSCARHLANRLVNTIVFTPSYLKKNESLGEELSIFQLTHSGTLTYNVKDLPSDPVDLIVNGLDCHESTYVCDQAWYQSAAQWANLNKAPVLSLDPPSSYSSSIGAKWALALGLPLSATQATQVSQVGSLYLGDIGIPAKVYQKVGIRFVSPYGNKLFIPLHE